MITGATGVAGSAAVRMALADPDVTRVTVLTQDEYVRITFDYAVAAAEAMYAANPGFTFCFLSGGGADSKEKSRILFARVKGRTENALLKAHPRVRCFRPGYIRPSVAEQRRGVAEKVIGPLLVGVSKLSDGVMIYSDDLARGMLAVAKRGHDKKILENRDILATVRG